MGPILDSIICSGNPAGTDFLIAYHDYEWNRFEQGWHSKRTSATSSGYSAFGGPVSYAPVLTTSGPEFVFFFFACVMTRREFEALGMTPVQG